MVIRVLVPAIVLVINVIVVREIRRRTSSDAANNLGLQHQHSASSNSAVPTVMLLTTSIIYVLQCGTSSVLNVVYDWTEDTSFSHQDILYQCWIHAVVLEYLVCAYNFYVYLITGRLFRSELRELFCSCSFTSSDASNDV